MDSLQLSAHRHNTTQAKAGSADLRAKAVGGSGRSIRCAKAYPCSTQYQPEVPSGLEGQLLLCLDVTSGQCL